MNAMTVECSLHAAYVPAYVHESVYFCSSVCGLPATVHLAGGAMLRRLSGSQSFGLKGSVHS